MGDGGDGVGGGVPVEFWYVVGSDGEEEYGVSAEVDVGK